jgi:PhzF family phenazine biosynthesis protein
MNIRLFQVDAFANNTFEGNPAAVCPLDSWPADSVLQNIASENNLSETAFFVKEEDSYHLRWFTPAFEIDLCGHATLASAHVLFQHLGFDKDTLNFNTLSGVLTVRKEDQYLSMNFPAWEAKQIEAPKELILGLGTDPAQVLKTRDYLAVFETEEEVRNIEPDFHLLSALEAIGVIVTAPGEKYDFISRFFAPRAGVNEDPVTGSAHSTLVPYWSDVLNKNVLHARQISTRGGELFCEMENDRVIIKGKAVTFLEGEINI